MKIYKRHCGVISASGNHLFWSETKGSNQRLSKANVISKDNVKMGHNPHYVLQRFVPMNHQWCETSFLPVCLW